jgi:hypothetical protein
MGMHLHKGTGDLVFIHDITEDGSHIMDDDTYRKISQIYIETNAGKTGGKGFYCTSTP